MLSPFYVMPMRIFEIFTICIIALLLNACASKTSLEVAPQDWAYQEQAIHIHIKSPADLNSISGRPHSLALGVFQLNDPNTFLGLSETREGALQLLNSGRIDESIVQFTRIILQPGEEKTANLPRAQAAKYVAIISGYFGLNTELDVTVLSIPIKAAKRGFVDLALSNLGLIADEAKAVPEHLYVEVSLGRKSTREFNQIDKETLNLLSTNSF